MDKTIPVLCGDCEHWRDGDSCRVNFGVVRDCDTACSLFSNKSTVKDYLSVECKLLKELEYLLKKYNTAIVRSANSGNDLVVSIQLSPTETKEFIFAEEISESHIRNEWYC